MRKCGIKKEQHSVHLRSSSSISVKVNPNDTFSPYLSPIVKGTPLPSHPVRTNAGPSSHHIRVPFSGDRFYGKEMTFSLDKEVLIYH